ncbi:hypothetical protein OIO90_000418 [Microbotryomycetes sp. JL221]|nr:hypothetical protein OIO90_000418 [Microbotryomycetes sp. JL221]
MSDVCKLRIDSMKADVGFVVAASVLCICTFVQIGLFMRLFRNKLVNPPKQSKQSDQRSTTASHKNKFWFLNRHHNDSHEISKEPLLATHSLGHEHQNLTGHDRQQSESIELDQITGQDTGLYKPMTTDLSLDSDQWSDSTSDSSLGGQPRRRARTIVSAPPSSTL